MYDVIIIGSGPGGYVSAIRAAQRGLKVACVDKRSSPGGTCLHVGCIPSKALLDSSHKFDIVQSHLTDSGIIVGKPKIDISAMMESKRKKVSGLVNGISFLLKKNGVDFILGEASLLDNKTVSVDGKSYEAKNIVIATGSETASIAGIMIDEKRILSSTGALDLQSVPKRMVVIGGGYIGVELGSVWSRLGSAVEIVEFADRILPGMDFDISVAAKKIFENRGLKFHTSSKVLAVEKTMRGLNITVESNGSKATMSGDVVLVSIGRKPYITNLGLEKVGIQIDNRGFVIVDDHWRTSAKNVYAIGDVIGGAMLAHKAEDEGIAVADIISGHIGHVDYRVIPAVVFTDPEIASVGKTEDDLKKENIEYRVGKFNFSANSRARAIGETDGFVKILSCVKTDRVLGCHIIGKEAGSMIHEVVVLMSFGGSAQDLSMICHAHPTFNEAIKEAALAVSFKAIHS